MIIVKASSLPELGKLIEKARREGFIYECRYFENGFFVAKLVK